MAAFWIARRDAGGINIVHPLTAMLAAGIHHVEKETRGVDIASDGLHPVQVLVRSSIVYRLFIFGLQ
jgi:hypothetical protein